MPNAPTPTSLGPATTAASWWRWQGKLHVTVVVKATFTMRPGATMLATTPPKVEPEELQPYLSQADLLYVGDAQLPKPVEAVTVRFGVFRESVLLDKPLPVRSDTPFSKKPVPVFGPTHAPEFGNDLSDDFDWEALQIAPPDQRSAYLRGDEWVVLEGLSANTVVLTSRLPNARGQARVRIGTAPPQLIAMWCDTLVAAGADDSCTVTWRGSFPIESEAELATATIWGGVACSGQQIDWPAEATLPDDAAAHAEDQVETVLLSDQLAGLEPPSAAPPKADGTVLLSDALHEDAAAEAATPFEAPKTQASTVMLSDDHHELAADAPATPFDAPKAGAAAPTPAAPKPQAKPKQPTGTVTLSESLAEYASSSPSTPFEAAASASPEATGAPAPQPPAPVSPQADPSSGHMPAAIPGSPWVLNPPQVAPAPVGDAQISHHLAPRARPSSASSDHPLPAAELFEEDLAAEEPEVALDPPPRTATAVPIRQTTPLTIATTKGALRPPTTAYTVIAKATCDLLAGEAAQLREECDLPIGDQPGTPLIDEPGIVSYPSDLAPFKPKADVVLIGSAYTRPTSPEASIVRFAFGAAGNQFDRRAAVFGPRTWEVKGMTAPKPFERVPLSWEYAYGGADDRRNPVGCGRSNDASGQRPLPQIEDPNHLIKGPGSSPSPMGFAPIPITWASRWQYLGSYDQTWLEKRWPHHPQNFDWLFHQAAPPPQQLEHLRGDEPFTIENVHPEHPVLKGTLPGIRARAFALHTEEAGGGLIELPMHLDTVVINSDDMQIDLVWRGTIEVSDWDANDLSTFFVFHEQLEDDPRSLSQVTAMLAAQLTPLELVTQEPEDDAKPANDIIPTPVTASAPDARKQAEADAHVAEQAQLNDALEHQTNELQKQIEEARAKAGLPPIDIRTAPPPEAPPASDIVSKMKSTGMSDKHIAGLFGSVPGVAAALGMTEAQAAQTSLGKNDIGELMQKSGVPQDKIDEVMADYPEPPEAPKPKAPPPAPPPSDAASSSPPSQRDMVIAALKNGDAFDGAALAGADLRELDFSGRSMKDAVLKNCDLSGCKFDACDLSGAQIGEATLNGASLVGAKLNGADLSGCVAKEAIFDEASLEDCQCDSIDASSASFSKTTGAKATFSSAQLSGARFDEAELPRLDLSGATLDNASFTSAKIARVRLYRVEGHRVGFGAADLSGARGDGAALPEANFENAQGAGSVWERATLDGASFLGGQLDKASFVRASLQGSVFSTARLRAARLDNATLTEASFLKSDLMGASLEGADLSHADLRGANLYGVASWRATTDGANFEQAYTAKSQLGGRR